MASSANVALDKAVGGGRLSRDEILTLYELPDAELSAAAHEVRLRHACPELVTYSIGGNIDYTNVCVVACKFCSFYRARNQDGAYTLTAEEIAAQMEALRKLGAREVCIQGGVNPDLPFEWYLEILRMLKTCDPSMHVDALSPEEILGLEELTGRKAPELLAELQQAGMDGLPGAAAEILVDEIRHRTAPTRIKTADWLRIIDAAQQLGLHIPWVSMVFGFGETHSQRVEHLLTLRAQQDHAAQRYGRGFAAFKVWPVRLEHTRLAKDIFGASAEAIARDYIRELAIARLALDNISHHRAVWRTMGFGVAQVALRSGADDLCGTGSINAIDAAMTVAGKEVPKPSTTVLEQVAHCIKEAGFTPALRDPYYNILEALEPAVAVV